MAWIDAQSLDDLYVSVISFGEWRKGTTILEPGKRRTELEAWIDDDVAKMFAGRVLPMTQNIETRMLLDSIDTGTFMGLRDRALIALMTYTFARVGASVGMKVEDVYTQGRRLWVRLHEKGGKEHSLPCHHNLTEYLLEYIDGAGIKNDPRARCSAQPIGAQASSNKRPWTSRPSFS